MITLQIAVFLLYAALVTVPFAVLVPGYLAWLRWGRRRVTPPRVAPPRTTLPSIDVLVPVHDEAAMIGQKLDDLAALSYPPDCLRILVVDGASTDGSWERIRARAAADPRFVPLRTDTAHKTRQLNAGLRRCGGAWVVVTDADARLRADTLSRLVEAGEADPAVAVVGTSVVPEHAHTLERLHWRMANLVRRHESDRGSASLVAGPCYAFRRTLLEQFPDDVVSDDVHVALAAAARGQRVVLADVDVTERRSPLRLADLFRHKLRKTDGYIREIFRFLPHAGRMASPARAIFLWRAAHLTILPVLLALGALGAALALAATGVPAGIGLVLPLLAAALFLASWWGLGRRSSPVLLLAHGVLLAAVTLAALVAYPFSRQTAAIPKIAGASGKGGDA